VRIAITGASGLIGTALQHRLRADGHEVVPIVRTAGVPDTIFWDPAAGRLDARDLEGLDGVVHLAGEGIGDRRWNEEHRRRVLESRRAGTTLLSEALAATSARPAVLVSGSAVGWYGDRGDEVLTEQSGPGTGFLTEVCQVWEAATAPAEAAGIRVAHLRTGIVFDASGGALPKMALPFKLFAGGRMGSGKQWMSWIHLDDEVGAIRFLLDHDVSGPVNATAPTPVTNAVLTKALGRALHRPAVVPVPAFGPRLVLGREMADSLLFISQRVLPEVLVSNGFELAHPDLDEALAAIYR
jgi:uncharacterized protein (TIGR01777 family)